MDNITVRTSKTVKLHAPEWFQQPDFQAWYNRKLGKGLATWQVTGQTLSNDIDLSASECAELAAKLTDVANADVWYEPSKTFSDDYEAEVAALQEVDQALSSVIRKLRAASEGNGLDIDAIQPIYRELNNDVVAAAPFFDPDTPDEQESLDSATDALDTVHNTLENRINRYLALTGDSYADCFITVEPQSPEGSDSDLPEPYWDIVVREAHKVVDGTEDTHVVVWISPA